MKNLRFKNTGVTLTEVMATMTIIGLITSTAVPMFGDMIENSRVTAAAEGLYAELQLARSEAIKSNSNKHLSVTNGTAWCYGVDVNAACNCDPTATTAVCPTKSSSITGVSLTSNTPVQDGIYLAPNGGVFDNTNTAVNGLITFSGENGKSISVILKSLGQVSLCSSSVSGYQSC